LLAFQLTELKPLIETAFINKVQFLGNDFYKLKLNTGKGAKDLIVFSKGMYITEYKLESGKEKNQFVVELNNKLKNERIQSIKQVNFDRVIELETQHYFLVFEFFADFNIVLTDKERQTVSCLREEEWKDRIIKRKKHYSFPAARGIDPRTLGFDDFREKIHSDKALVRQLSSFINLGPVFLEEAAYLAGIDKTIPSNKLSESQLKKLFNELQAIALVDEKKLKPLTVETGKETYFLPFPLHSLKGTVKESKSINDALDEFYSKSLEGLLLEPERKALDEKIASLSASLGEQLAAKKSLEGERISSKEKAEFIYSNFPDLQALVDEANKAIASKKSREQILKALAGKKNRLAKSVKDIDLKKKLLIIEA
jgi:predicted ribosome quality control (RQC) complex YloA/Tae2 family protein